MTTPCPDHFYTRAQSTAVLNSSDVVVATETDALLNKQAWISNKVFFRIDISTQQWEAGVGTEIPERLRVARNRPRWCAESTEF